MYRLSFNLVMPPRSLPPKTARVQRDSTSRQILPAQVRLLYSNANIGVAVTLGTTPILGLLQWGAAPHPLIIEWALCMLVVAVARFTLVRRYWRTPSTMVNADRWGAAFAVGAGLAGAGWGAAGVLLYSETHLANQLFLAFILGGMMLGAASLLARHTALAAAETATSFG